MANIPANASQRFSPESIPAGTLIGRYRVGAKLGVGKAAIVYRADDTALSRPVAIKFLKAEDLETRLRFQREAKTASSLNHKNIVSIYDFGEFRNVPYIVMELVTGGSLEDVVRRKRPLSPDEAARVGVQAAKALDHVHNHGFIHRDITPANLFLASDGTIKLGDLGLARGQSSGSNTASNPQLTKPGVFLNGSPEYTAPELFLGGQATAVSDVYSLALTLWFLMSGKKPVDGSNLPEILYKQCNVPLPDLRQEVPGVSPALAGVLSRAASKKPEDRPTSAANFARELRQALTNPGISGSSKANGALDPLNPMSGSVDSIRRMPEYVLNPDSLLSRQQIAVRGAVPGALEAPPSEGEDDLANSMAVENTSRRRMPGAPRPIGQPGLPTKVGLTDKIAHALGLQTLPIWMAGLSVAIIACSVVLASVILFQGRPEEPTKDPANTSKIDPAAAPDDQSGKTPAKPAVKRSMFERLGKNRGIERLVDAIVREANTARDDDTELDLTAGGKIELSDFKESLANKILIIAGQPAEPGRRDIRDMLDVLALSESQCNAFKRHISKALDRAKLETPDDRADIQRKLGELLVPSQRPQQSKAPKSVINSLGMNLVLIPAGEFDMGSPDAEENRNADEELLHRVRLTRPFYMGVYEVTQAEYKAVMGSHTSKFEGDRRPVEMVTWNEAVEFCDKLSQRPEEMAAGRRYRLPTEAEWEYACRGLVNRNAPYNTGQALPPNAANIGSSMTADVGCFPPNDFGLHDMHGNVWEWCQDVYSRDSKYYEKCKAAGIVDDPKGPESNASPGEERVCRGGGYNSPRSYARSASRFGYSPETTRLQFVGFRVVMEVPAK